MKQKLKKFFTDKHGKVVLWQAPNVWLIGWAVFLVLSMIFKRGAVHGLTSGLSSGFIVIWAALEIFKGASPFRRVLGVVVLIATLSSVITKFF